MDIRSVSFEPQHVRAYEKLKSEGKFKSLSQFVRRCVEEHFETEFPDLVGEAAIARAEELEFAAKQYRAMAFNSIPLPPEREAPSELSAEEEEVFKAKLEKV